MVENRLKMAQPTIPRFLECLGNSQLLSDAQLKRLKKQLKGNSLDAEGLAQVLIRQKHLTEWQAKQLLKGQSGFVLNQYRLLNPIGRGGMGHVFRGLDVSNKATVAVKVMARKLTSNETLVSRFQREIRASSELDCPYIVKTLDAGRVGKVDFMVMEYVNGDQVDRIANRLGRVPVGLACAMIGQIAEGLQHAHEHQMVHRDIKPGNMMIHWDESGLGTTKLMDMGLVLVMNDDQDNSVTRTGQVMGTPDYMSPEQGWDTTQVDIRSDIYSLGCTLFRLLTGTIPFSGSNPVQVLSQRLQRDAPSVQTVCDDIPDEVAAIVSKMTLRDPDARYQSPREVAEALAAVSEPLLKKSFVTAARNATNDPKAAFSDPQNDEVDESDGTYQRFLSEVDKGSTVDLMIATDAGANVHAQTLPTLDISVDADTSAARTRVRPHRGQKTGFWIFGGAALVVLLLIAGIMLSGGNDEEQPTDTGDAMPPPVVVQAVGNFVAAETMTVATGNTWTYIAKSETSNITGKVEIEVGDTAPVGIRLQDATSELSWNVPVEQSTGEYSIPIRLVHVLDDRREILDETSLKVKVTYGTASVQLPDPPPQELDAGAAFEMSLAVDSDVAAQFDLTYHLTGKVPDGLTIHQKSGLLTWKPTAADFGRYTVNATVSDAGANDLLDEQRVIILVLPTTIADVLPSMKKQKAQAGKPFQFRFPESDVPRLSRVSSSRVIEFAEKPTAGMSIAPDNSVFLWDVPENATGIVKVPFKARMEFGPTRRDRNLKGTAVLEIEVAATTPPPPSDTLPSAEEIEPALAELRNTYKQRLAAARSIPQKAVLAAQLIDLTHEAEKGVADAALLELIETDLATRARAIDVMFDIAAVRAERYGTDELAAAAEIVPQYRRTTADPGQQDSVMEHCLRLAKKSVAAKNYKLTDELLQLVTSVLRGANNQGAAGQLTTDITSAAGLAQEITKQPDAATNEIKIRDLTRLLVRWQFRPMFADGAGLNHFGVTAAGTGDVNGRDLWKIKDSVIRLESMTRQAAVGFLTRTPRDRFVLRLEMLPVTTSAQIIISATGSGDADFKAFGVVLDSSGPGRVISIRSRSSVADPTGLVRLHSDRANRVEVAVDGKNVSVRINGSVAFQAQVAELEEGRIGIAANLGTPEPKVLLRNVRILDLPDSP